VHDIHISRRRGGDSRCARGRRRPFRLELALQAHAYGVRVIEWRGEAFWPSRALILPPRTLEVLRPLGVTDTLRARRMTRPRTTCTSAHGWCAPG
jgi:2-polyprenyl-6-methoxyphenol hydroxylase-like FAD-dependent oxidoreductase